MNLNWANILFLSIISILSFSTNSKSQEFISKDNLTKQDSIYLLLDRLQLDEGKKKCYKLLQDNPSDPSPHILLNYADFLELFIGEEYKQFEKLSKYKNQRIKAFDKLKNNNPWKNYGKSVILLHWAFTRIKFGEYFTAVFEVNKAFKLLNENTKQHPKFAPNYVALGLLHTLIGSIPKTYQRMLAFVSTLEGNIAKGKQELNSVKESKNWKVWYPHLKTESLFFLGYIEMNLSPDRKNITKFIKETHSIKSSSIKTFLLANLYIKNYQNDSALHILNNKKTYNKSKKFHYLNLLHGEVLLKKGNPLSKYYLNKFIIEFKGSHYLRQAKRHLAWAYLIENNKTDYLKWINEIPKNGATLIDADIQAMKEFNSQNPPNIFLLKARLAFDGGYFDNALSILHNIPNINQLSTKEQIEVIYRKARIFQEQKKINLAIKYFKKSLEKSQDKSWYFSGKSSLELGKLFEIKNNTQTAIYYYELCLKLDFEEYKTSITQKAKAGLNRLK
ncbi:MAG: tetratricopeptide repeat protein [Bacteroidales bacterium]